MPRSSNNCLFTEPLLAQSTTLGERHVKILLQGAYSEAKNNRMNEGKESQKVVSANQTNLKRPSSTGFQGGRNDCGQESWEDSEKCGSRWALRTV